MSAAVPGVADEIEALRRLIRRHRRRTLTQSGGFRQSRRRAVTRRYSRRRILRAVARSGSLREAARRLGCAPSTLSRNTDPRVREAVNRFRRPPSPPWFPGDAREIATHYGAGWSLQRIASGYGCAARHMREVLREAGVEFGTSKPQAETLPRTADQSLDGAARTLRGDAPGGTGEAVPGVSRLRTAGAADPASASALGGETRPRDLLAAVSAGRSESVRWQALGA